MSVFGDFAKDLGNRIFGQPDDGKTPLSPVKSAGEQDPDEKKLVAYIREKIDQVRQSNSRIALEGIALTNVAYLLGFDGIYYDTTYRQFRNNDPKRKLSRNRFKINKILPTVQNRLARLCQSPPKFDVRPNSNSSEDKDSARLALQIIEDVFDKQNFNERQQELLMNAMQGGVAYLQPQWDPTLGNPMFDEEGNLTGFEGDVRIDVLSVLEVFQDPLAKSLDDAQWVIKAKVRKLDYFKEHYPERGSAVKEEQAWLLSSLYDMKSNALTAVGIVGASTTEQQKNSAIEVVYYEKRSKEYPNGRMVVMASGILLEDKELPIGEYDIVKFDDVLVGGRYNSEAIITHLRPIQDQYNIARTKCADWIRKTLGGKYLSPKGSGLSQEAINNDSGEVVEYNPVPGAPPPTAMSIPTIPAYVYQDLERLEKEFDLVSGINEVSRGVAPGADMPFRAMALLVEQDQTRISVQTNRNEIGYAKAASIALRYVGKYYVMPRLLKLAGDGLEYTVKEFTGKDINDNYDVIVVAGSTVPQSKVLKRQDILNTFQLGLLGDPADPKLRAKVLKYMEFGDIAEVWKSQAVDEQQVKKVIGQIEDGTFNPKNPGHEWDNHVMFIQEMNEYRKSDKYEELEPKSRQIFDFVAEWHVQALVALTQPQIPQQMAMANMQVQQMQNMKASGEFQNQMAMNARQQAEAKIIQPSMAPIMTPPPMMPAQQPMGA